MLNPTASWTVTFSVEESYEIVPIPTPAPLWVGINVGSTLLIPLVFFRISTVGDPGVTFRSTSETSFSVLPSRTTSFGGIENPFPKDVTPIESKTAKGSTFTICGYIKDGDNVGSDG